MNDVNGSFSIGATIGAWRQTLALWKNFHRHRSQALSSASVSVVAGILSLAGCRWFDACLYETRATEAVGQLSEAGTEILYAKVNMSEQRDYQPNRSLYWFLRGETLRGHVTSAVLIDSRDTTKVLYEFPITPTQAGITEGSVDQNGGAQLSGLFDVVAGGRARVRVRTDLPGRETISVPTMVTLHEDWIRPNCS